MSSGAVTLSRVKSDFIEVKCDKCKRHGKLSKRRLMKQHGVHAGLPDVLAAIARDVKCPKVGSVNMYDRCGIKYVGEF